ncbi:hypothetical protein N7519_006490 [Penicillium mononematosum]|uniref:uncharacterized protein n=1 Tax=Penicillium mononematosum TaxID=268346 RepID=UPI002547E789|nr:uncharacterized protein N7519_006490 [Penicillium mononematosum]KAJ6185189.1 hypothetical protein N7519_006490 [Penicillium mononematosum]
MSVLTMPGHFLIFVLIFLFAATGNASRHNPLLRLVYQFPNATWVENIAVRPNGNLLVTLVNTPELWEIKPSRSLEDPEPQARMIHHFSDAEMATGITELTPDVYAVIASNHVWKVQLDNTDGEAMVTPINTIPIGSLNGIAVLNRAAGLVAIADSQLGLVWRLDTNSGNYSAILKDETMAPNTDIGPLLGVNGVKVLGDYVYYVNTPRRLYGRVRVNTITGQAVGPYEVISKGVPADDFAITPRGVAYLAGLTDNVVVRAFLNGTQEVVAGSLNSSAVKTATSAALGRNQHANILYITTGGETGDVTTYSGKGKVMALTLDA